MTDLIYGHNNRTFKIISRYMPEDQQKSWSKGKPGLQHKKKIYTSILDYKQYSPKLLERWRHSFDVTEFELIKGEWIPYD